MVSNVSDGTFKIEKALQMKKVLIVVDDIDDQDMLNTLFGTEVFHTESKIIITTRLLNIDTWFQSISRGCHVHKVELLNNDESLELLSYHAFGSKTPMEGFEDLAIQLAQYCEGNPLALKVLGSSLPVRAQDQWTRNNMIETWRSRINSLNSLKGDLDQKIQCVLRKSFESLPCDSHKELFLHIASLFIGEYVYQVEKILENDWHAKSGIMTLINRCLVTKSKDGSLAMHKLLEDMASKIVSEESKDPAKRSRVWRKDESYRLLRKGDGSKIIEGLLVDMGEVEQWMTSEMLYEYGIRSTYLQGIKDRSMATHEYTSSSSGLSFRVPLHPKKHRIQGLYVTVLLYRSSSGEEDRNTEPQIFARISNISKNVTWVYNPVVYCKPGVDEDAVWLSYWPIGNTLGAGDEVHVNIFTEELGGIESDGSGASIVYMDADELEIEEEQQQQKCEEEVIGGDLSRFEVTKGGYYLCRKNFFRSRIPAILFGDNIQITDDSQRWRTRGHTRNKDVLNDFRNSHRDKYEVTLGVSFNSESEIDKIEKAVCSVAGVESVTTHKEIGRLIVCGCFDHQTVATCVRQFEKMVQILERTPITS